MIKILEMLENPESDKDELNARIWCFEKHVKFLEIRGNNRPRLSYDNLNYAYKGDRNISSIPKYITSLDAAMSIGAEELEGWFIQVFVNSESGEPTKNGDVEYLADITRDNPYAHKTSPDLPDMPRAICHARCQALDYVRGL